MTSNEYYGALNRRFDSRVRKMVKLGRVDSDLNIYDTASDASIRRKPRHNRSVFFWPNRAYREIVIG